jgi:glycine hydroxymethyltransferase
VPFDDKSPFVTSGIRVGVPAITTRGLKENDMKDVVNLVDKILMNLDDEKIIGEVKNDVEELMSKFPLYPELG